MLQSNGHLIEIEERENEVGTETENGVVDVGGQKVDQGVETGKGKGITGIVTGWFIKFRLQVFSGRNSIPSVIMMLGLSVSAVNCLIICRGRDKEKEQEIIPKPSKIRRPYKYWDVAPAGFEHITPVQYKVRILHHHYHVVQGEHIISVWYKVNISNQCSTR